MTKHGNQVLADALKLPPVERAELVEKILTSFSFPDRPSIDSLWAEEAEDRLAAHDRGEIGSTSARDVFSRIDQRKI